MNSHYLYLVSFIAIFIPVFSGLAILGHRRLTKYWHVPLYVGLIGLMFAVTERFAFSWNLWEDNRKYILTFRILDVQPETYLLNFLLFAAVACSTVLLIKRKPSLKRHR